MCLYLCRNIICREDIERWHCASFYSDQLKKTCVIELYSAVFDLIWSFLPLTSKVGDQTETIILFLASLPSRRIMSSVSSPTSGIKGRSAHANPYLMLCTVQQPDHPKTLLRNPFLVSVGTGLFPPASTRSRGHRV